MPSSTLRKDAEFTAHTYRMKQARTSYVLQYEGASRVDPLILSQIICSAVNGHPQVGRGGVALKFFPANKPLSFGGSTHPRKEHLLTKKGKNRQSTQIKSKLSSEVRKSRV